MELQSLEYAAEILSELWSKLVIDRNPVVAEYIKEETSVIIIKNTKSGKQFMCGNHNICFRSYNALIRHAVGHSNDKN